MVFSVSAPVPSVYTLPSTVPSLLASVLRELLIIGEASLILGSCCFPVMFAVFITISLLNLIEVLTGPVGIFFELYGLFFYDVLLFFYKLDFIDFIFILIIYLDYFYIVRLSLKIFYSAASDSVPDRSLS
jgi:hypothetical protein